MKLVKALVTAAVITGAALSAPAMAVDISSSPEVLVMVDGTAHFGASFSAGNMGNTFSNQYSFSISSTNHVDTLVASIAHSDTLGLTITGYHLYDSGASLIASGALMSSGVIDLWTITTSGLASGDYYVEVSGLLNSQLSASFSGNLNVTLVPEPESYAMLLAGLGLIGAAARRRRKGS